MPTPPLAGLRVLDVSRQLPGPLCSTILGDLGADVLVVGAPGDPFGAGMPFLTRNKRSMTLNLKHPDGLALFRRLADRADVVLEGWRPGVARRLGVDFETLRATNPSLIYCAISGYGQDGPYAARSGHDVNYLATAGVLEYIGRPDAPPIVPGVQIADIGGGSLMAAIGILTAIVARQTTGRGQYVDVAMCDGALFWNVYHVMLRMFRGQLPRRGGEQTTGGFPCYGVYETKDGRHLTIGAFEEHFWANLCRHLGREDLIATQWSEGPERDRTFAFLRETFRTKTLAEWNAELGSLDICYAPVNTVDEAFADPQLRHRGMVLEVDGPGGRTVTLGSPIKLSETPASLRTPPVPFGHHTDDVLRELGCDDARIGALRAAGVL